MNTIVAEIKELPTSLRPRELLQAQGASYLSDIQLLAVLLGSGSRGRGVFSVSRDLLALLEAEGFDVDIDSLTSIPGLGRAKAGLILAAFEFTRRCLHPNKKKITSPGDIYPMISHYGDRNQEYFLCLSLNGAHEVLAIRVVSIGLVNRAMVHPREVFAEPIAQRCAAIAVAHNHPSGILKPSPEDKEVTRRLKEAGEILGIPLLDHVIFSDSGFYSFMEAGEL
ncbi:MAG: DNA repair protein RadC [Spirochaetales bacterium]|nr:DNA repair protein RadC [Spirochaetales bacterium]